MRFEGKTVVVTGASAGIGLAACRQFAAEGATVVLAARGVEALERAAQEVRGIAVPADVGDVEACRALIEATVERTGRLDVLVNNAGAHMRGRVGERTVEELATMCDVNVRAPIVLAGLALPHLRASRGALVNVASLAGCVPLPGAATYSASKFALRAFSRALMMEEERVRVSVVSPGPVDTGFIMDSLDEVADITFSQPISTAQEVAAAIVHFAAEGQGEQFMPTASGVLSTAGYLMPSLYRAIRPLMERRGKAIKERIRASR